MVTIDQKLSLFQKLLHRSMTEKFIEELEALRKEHDEKFQKNKALTDKEAEEILNRSLKKAGAEKVELLSKARIGLKRESMSVKEKCFNTFMDRLKKEMENFVQSDRYEAYLLSLVKEVSGQEQLSGRLVIYLTARDIERYGDGIKRELKESKQWEVSFKTADSNITGGLLAEAPDGRVRINLFVDALLEDSKPYIMQVLFHALETGEENGE
jgi:vacuolar-type H+-ATPase subunit E/Vma4